MLAEQSSIRIVSTGLRFASCGAGAASFAAGAFLLLDASMLMGVIVRNGRTPNPPSRSNAALTARERTAAVAAFKLLVFLLGRIVFRDIQALPTTSENQCSKPAH